MSSSRENQALLRRIVLEKNRRAASGSLKKGEPVKGGTGIYPFGGTDKDAEKEKEKDKEKDKDKEKKTDGSPPMNPKDIPKEGDDGRGIGPFYPCDGNGNCVNLRLDGMALPPEGWADACTPPETGDEEDGKPFTIWRADAGYTPLWDTPVKMPTKWFLSDSEALAAVTGFIPEGKTQSGESARAVVSKPRGTGYGGADFYKIEKDGYKKGVPQFFSGQVSRVECGKNSKWEPCVQMAEQRKERHRANRRWPPKQCSEVIATPDGFQAACEEHDPSLPPNLRGGAFTAFELCDENGNPVTVSVDDVGGGWNIDHPDYEAHINSDFKVQGVRRKPKN